MDEFFLRELLIFFGVTAIFLGSVPILIRGHHADPIESTLDGSGVAAIDETEASEAPRGGVKVSRKRRARAREGAQA